MAFIYKDRVKETTITTGTGALALAGAASGYQSFSAVGDGNTCIYAIEASDGGWEVGLGTYTATGTTLARTAILSSSAGGSVLNLPAGTHNVYLTADSSALRNGFLRSKTESPTTSGVAAELGTMHVLSLAGLTADRDFTLPATAAVGDRVGVLLASGNSTYHMLLKPATGDAINGGALGAEFDRVKVTGACVVFRCVTANSEWIVESSLGLNTTQSLLTYMDRKFNSGFFVTTDNTSVQSIPSGSYAALHGGTGGALKTVEWNPHGLWSADLNGRFTPPAGRWRVHGIVTVDLLNTTAKLIVAIRKNGETTPSRLLGRGGYASQSSANLGFGGSVVVEANGTDYFQLVVFQDSGGSLNTSPLTGFCYFSAEYEGPIL